MQTNLAEISDFGQIDTDAWIAILHSWLQPLSSKQEADLRSSLRKLLPSAHQEAEIRFLHPKWGGPGVDPLIENRDFSLVNAFGVDPAEVEQQVGLWAHGQCALLAIRMHEWSGWPILAIQADHFCVQRPDGALVDAYGVLKPASDRDCSHFDTLTERYEAWGAEWTTRDAPSLAGMTDESGRAEADEFINGRWMKVVFPLRHRLSDPITYLPIEHDAWVPDPNSEANDDIR